jgi:hypothetical protein
MLWVRGESIQPHLQNHTLYLNGPNGDNDEGILLMTASRTKERLFENLQETHYFRERRSPDA